MGTQEKRNRRQEMNNSATVALVLVHVHCCMHIADNSNMHSEQVGTLGTLHECKNTKIELSYYVSTASTS